MPGSTNALKECRNRFGRTDLAHQVDVADIDSHLERCGRNNRLQLALLVTYSIGLIALVVIGGLFVWRGIRKSA